MHINIEIFIAHNFNNFKTMNSFLGKFLYNDTNNFQSLVCGVWTIHGTQS